MTRRHSRQEVPYSAEEMFNLVADIERYPEFLPWCVALRMISQKEKNGIGELTADMIVAYSVFREKFRSNVRLDRGSKRIDVAYVDGPFRNLRNVWAFEDLADGGAIVDFEIEFEFRSLILQSTAHAVFDRAFAKMSDAFVDRARTVYGPR